MSLIFTGPNNQPASRQVRRAFSAGSLLRISAGIYVKKGVEPVEVIVNRNWHRLVAHLVPDGVITDRTGFTVRPVRSSEYPDAPKQVFISAPRSRNILKLPGLWINIREGAGPVEGFDIPYLGTHLACAERRLLDNLTPSRAKKDSVARTLGSAEIERELDKICRLQGEKQLPYLLERARSIAPSIGRQVEFERLAVIAGAIMNKDANSLQTPEGRARATGRPFDANCVGRLVKLADYLHQRSPQHIASHETSESRRATGCFFDAYFSNYIEGVRFAVDAAAAFVFGGVTSEDRLLDAQDILATYSQLGSPAPKTPSQWTAEEFLDELRVRHRELMGHRPGVNPGVFKSKPNRAGDTAFVQPDLVEGTFREGMRILRTLDHGFQRAVYLHYLIAEVHPFDDGNGRLSRIIANKELEAAGLSRIVIPTIYGDDYIAALRSLSKRDDPSVLVRSLEFCQRVTAACSTETFSQAMGDWASAYAFCENQREARLSMPTV